MRCSGRDLPKIQCSGSTGAVAHEEKTPTPHVPRVRQRHSEREAHSYSSVYGVPALEEHAVAYARGDGVTRHDHAFARRYRPWVP